MVKEAKKSRRAHPCSRCDSTFKSPSERDRHVRTVHEKRKDHACPHCAAAFGEAGSLTKHVRTVHEKRKDHACPHCTAAFGEAHTRLSHMRTQHPNNTQGNDCPVCDEGPLVRGAATTANTPCNHRFCRACIEAELGRSGKCPLCQQDCAVADLW